MNVHIKKTYRCRYLLTTTIIFAAVAVPAYAYMLRDNDARTEEIKAALPEAKAPTALVSKGINVDDVKDMVAAKAAAHGVPTDLARAVVQVESDYDIGLTGSVGEVGLMQIKFETARLLGYTGTLWELYEPETNIEWGMRYLAGARRLADGDLCGTAMRYNGGHGLKRMSRATTVYCNKIKRVLGLPTDSVPNGDPRDDRKDMVAARKDQSRRPEMFAAKQDKPAVVKLAAATVPAVATPAVPAPAAVAPGAVVAAERKIIAVAKPAKPVHHKADDEADGFEVRIVSHDVSETPIERKRVVPATTHRANVAGPFRLAEAFPDQPDSQAWFAEPKHETVAKPKPVATVAKAKPLPTVIKPKPIETAAAPQPAETVARTPVQRVAHAKPAVPVAHAQPAVPVTYVQPAMPVAHAQPAVQAAQPKAVASTVQPKPMVAMAQPKPVAPATQPKPVALAKTRSAVLAKPNPVETAATTTPAEPADTTGSIGVAPAQATVGEPNPAPVAQAKPRLAAPAKPKPVYTVARTFEPADAPLGILPAPQLFERPETIAHARPVALAKPRLVAPANPKPVETAASTPAEPSDAAASEATTVVGKTHPATAHPATAPVKTVTRRKPQQSGDGMQTASGLPLGGGVTRGDRLRIADHTAE